METVDDALLDDIRAQLEKLGWDQKTFAEKIHVSEGTISNLFKPGEKQIRYRDRIMKAFGWADSAKIDEVLRRIQRASPRVPVEQLENLAELAESLARKR